MSVLNYKDPTTGEWKELKSIAGKSAYEYAQDGGYTGTETEFAAKLAEDPTVFYVNVTDNGDGTWTADKTIAEIVEAYNAGRPVYAISRNVMLPLTSLSTDDPASAAFATSLSIDAERVDMMVVISGDTAICEITSYDCDRFYETLPEAIDDVNNGLYINIDTDAWSNVPKVKVTTSDTGVTTVTLLADVSISEALTISKSCDIVLNGHKLTLASSAALLNIAEGIDCTIWGNIPGSAIVKEGITDTSTTNVFFLTIRGGNVRLIGGEYTFKGSVEGSTVMLASTATCGNLEIDGCTIRVENTSATSTGVLYGFQNRAVNATIRNSTITVNGVVNTIAGIRNPSNLTLEKATVKAALSADGCLKEVYAISNTGTLTTEDCYILADSKGIHAEDDEPAIGILNQVTGTAHLKNTTVTGTHSGLQNDGKLYISGGTYTGYCHGGIYFAHGVDGIGYVNDAMIRDGHYEGVFTDYFDALTDHSWGGFYVGGGTDERNSNMTVYMDNCTIEGVKWAIAMRASSGETNNTVNLSNCTIVDGVNKPINCYETTVHTVNIGTGCNVTTEMATEPTCLKFTGKLYRKMHGDKVLDGKDFGKLHDHCCDEWETIIDYTVPEDCVEVLLTTDLNGNPFKLKRAIVTFVTRPIADPSARGNIRYTVDGSIAGVKGVYAANHYTHGFQNAPTAEGKYVVQQLEVIDTPSGVWISAAANIGEQNWVDDDLIAVRWGNSLTLYQEFNSSTLKSKVTEISAAGVGSYLTSVGAGSRIVMMGVRY